MFGFRSLAFLGRSILSPTGGLGYHFAAWRFRSEWKPFCARVQSWLEHWNPPEKHLMLFGPSAGYTLPESFLQRFERIHVIEPDPFACALLRARFRSVKERMVFSAEYSVLPWWHEDEADPGAALKAFSNEIGTPVAVLFANFLGQLPLLKLNYEEPRLREAFGRALVDTNWASYHDLFSGRAKDLDRCPDSVVLTGDTEALARRFFRNEAEVVDHGTTWLGEGKPVPVCRWPLNPKRAHVIAFVSHLRREPTR